MLSIVTALQRELARRAVLKENVLLDPIHLPFLALSKYPTCRDAYCVFSQDHSTESWMWVSGASWWSFLGFFPRSSRNPLILPALPLSVLGDPPKIAKYCTSHQFFFRKFWQARATHRARKLPTWADTQGIWSHLSGQWKCKGWKAWSKEVRGPKTPQSAQWILNDWWRVPRLCKNWKVPPE